MQINAVVVSLFCIHVACTSDKPQTSETDHSQTKPSLRTSMRSWRPLLKEVLRAELFTQGVSVDFGTPDQHKYTRGSWETGWDVETRSTKKETYARTSGGDSSLFFWLRSIPKEAVLRVRAPKGKGNAKLSLSVTGPGRKKVLLTEDLDMSDEWQVLRVPIAKGNVATGRNQLTIHSKSVVEVDWLWLATVKNGGDFANVPRTLPIRFENGSRRALVAPSSRVYSFFLHVPVGAKLIVDIGSEQESVFKVDAQTSSGTVNLLSQKATPNQWREATIDLSKVAGQAIRLDLATESPPGKCGWGEPEIMIPEAKKTKNNPPGKKAKNLVYVVMDTTRADSFATIKSNTDVLTPSYDALAAKSTTFRNAYNNENWTKPSVTTMWSGLYPSTHEARQATSKVDKKIRFLPQQLQDHGFTTGAFIANAVVSETFGFNKGWTEFNNYSNDDKKGNSSELYPLASEWLTKHKKDRFFLYVQSVDPHTTYSVPQRYWSKYYKGTYKGQLGSQFTRDLQIVVDNGKLQVTDDDLAWIWALYKGEVTYQDHYLGGLIAKLKELQLLENTLIVVTNDHGEEIQDHGAMGHGWPLFEEQTRAPLLMSYPKLFAPGRSITEVIEHVDLAPTILDALGVPPIKSAEGISFLPLLEDGIGKRQHPFYSVAWSRKGIRSVRVGNWKLIVGKNSDWLHLFNLENDPAEKKNLLKKNSALSSKALLAGRLCEVYMAETLATPNKAKRMDAKSGLRHQYSSQEIAIDEATRKELEALGYL